MIISGTGHRPDKLGGYDDSIFMSIANFAGSKLLELTKSEIDSTTVITGMALGWDQMLAEACRMTGFKYIAAIPFEGQEKAWPQSSQEKYKSLLKDAKEVVVVSDGSYAAWKMQTRNIWMVDRADVVLALWNKTSGGTKNCIDYASAQNKTIVNCWDEWQT